MQWIVGVDEVGRGPLAGPVAVGAYAVKKKEDIQFLSGIKDSKKMSEKQRKEWCAVLTHHPNVRYAVAFASAASIDKHGITVAIQAALVKALFMLHISPRDCIVLLDGGLAAPHTYQNQRTIVKGDSTERVIAAAAIVAKVKRDNKMVCYDKKYPGYGFAQHKGYGTALHRTNIETHGLSPIHRRTFCKNIRYFLQK